jgi:hypothetical protein
MVGVVVVVHAGESSGLLLYFVGFNVASLYCSRGTLLLYCCTGVYYRLLRSLLALSLVESRHCRPP